MIRSFFICITLILFANTAHAEDNYSNIPVTVDETDVNAVKARQKALSEGEKNAFGIMFKNVIRKEDYSDIPPISPEEIHQTVSKLDVVSEKIGPKHYHGEIKFSFDREKVQKLINSKSKKAKELSIEKTTYKEAVKQATVIQENSSAKADDDIAPSLLLPVLVAGKKTAIWSDDEFEINAKKVVNPWWASWQSVLASKKGGLFVMPLGDLQDMKNLDALEIADSSFKNKKNFSDRYNTSDIYIAKATYNSAKKELSITVEKQGGEKKAVYTKTYAAIRESALGKALTIAAKETLPNLETQAKKSGIKLAKAPKAGPVQSSGMDYGLKMDSDTKTAPAPKGEIDTKAVVDHSGLGNWMETNNQIKSVNGVTGVLVNSLTAKQAVIVIKHVVPEKDLIKLLQDKNIAAVKDGGHLKLKSQTKTK